MEGSSVMAIIEKGHWCAEIDTSYLEDVEVKITLHALETSESLLESDGQDLQREYTALRYAINEYINHLYELREGGLAYAV